MIINFIRGFCMALADSVPGVSGGTVAFLLGFYDKFIQSLNDIFAGNKAQRLEAVKFLAKLLVGWLVGFCSAVLVLTSPHLCHKLIVFRLHHCGDSLCDRRRKGNH